MRVSYGYAPDRSTALYGEAERIYCSVHKDCTGRWRWHVAIQVRAKSVEEAAAWAPPEQPEAKVHGLVWMREGGEAPNRKVSLARVRCLLEAHFGRLPAEARLRDYRGAEKALSDAG